MEESGLALALSEVCEKGLLSKEDTELPKGFKFSKAFEQRMSEIMGRGRIHLRKRLKLALFVAAIFAVGFMLGMAARPKWGYVSRDADEGMMMTFDVSSVENPKTRIEQKYTLAGIPEGLERDKDSPWLDTDYMYCEAWGTFDGKGNGLIDVFFGQYIPAAYRNVFISDKDKKHLVTEDNGVQYYVLRSDEGEEHTAVIWYQDGYVFLVDAKMPKDDALELCKTLKIQE